MLPENRTFFIRGDDGEEYGPVDMAELREWVRENRAGLGTSVRPDEANSRWQPWQYYPELVALLAEVRVATPVPGHIAAIWRRVAAWCLDVFLLSFLLFPVKYLVGIFIPIDAVLQAGMNLSTLQKMPASLQNEVLIFEIVINACLVFYLAGFHAARGQTPAKTIFHIRVVDHNGQKPSLRKSLLRALVLILSINFVFPLIYVFFNPQRRTFHDFVAGTYVVET